MSDFNYSLSLKKDLAEQFKEKPNIEALCEVVGKQMQDVWQFFSDMGLYRLIDNAVGAQLDQLGLSVGISREKAVQMAAGTGASYATEDDLYRTYIKYQISLNSSQGTYSSVMNSIRMQTDSTLAYGEEPNMPATIILSYEMFNGDDHNNVTNIPVVRPAGVGIRFRSVMNGEISFRIGGGAVEASTVRYSMMERTSLPNYLCDENYNILCDENWWILCEDGDDM